jgi:hypothetical protein
MFKCTAAGVVELGKVIKLTEADLIVLQEEITERSTTPTIHKIDGHWEKKSVVDIMDGNFSVVEFEEKEVSVTDLLDQAVTWQQVMAVPLDV